MDAVASRPRLRFWRVVFCVILALGIVGTFQRFAGGLGRATHMSDAYPWGIWKAFNVLAAIGLGGAGFTIMGVAYVLHVERFRPIVRPTLLMAFLAYVSASISLFVDIGRPWAIWHPIVMWNTHSVLFEVAWCLMLYTAVLFLEGSGMLFERLGWKRMVRIQHAVTIPIVIAGVILSTLHQSSLGALFLIVPGKLHPLWYSADLPLLFFISAICMGLSMVIVLSRLSARAFRRTLEVPLLTDLSRFLLYGLCAYGFLRLYALERGGAFTSLFSLSYETVLFHVEFFLGVVAPIVILGSEQRRRNARRLYAAALMVVMGFVAYRLNVAIVGFEAHQGGHYVPAWSEVAFSLMMVALAFAAYAFGVQHLDVYPEVTERAGSRPPAASASRKRPPAGGDGAVLADRRPASADPVPASRA